MDRFPETFHRVVGELPEAGRLPSRQEFPFGTLRPVRDGFIERKGVKSWYAVYGETGAWIAFAPIFQISHTQMLKATVIAREWHMVPDEAGALRFRYGEDWFQCGAAASSRGAWRARHRRTTC